MSTDERKSEWQCQLCGGWVVGAICECTLGARPLQPEDAWPIPPDDGDGDVVAVTEGKTL